jgi:hypothetical protein
MPIAKPATVMAMAKTTSNPRLKNIHPRSYGSMWSFGLDVLIGLLLSATG